MSSHRKYENIKDPGFVKEKSPERKNHTVSLSTAPQCQKPNVYNYIGQVPLGATPQTPTPNINASTGFST